MAQEKLYSIQYLRALAAILVVYLHSINLQINCGGVSFQQNFYFLKTIGSLGVDLFFIISGFIICYVSSKESGIKSFVYFLKKRFIRINPVFYLSCLILFFCYLIWNSSVFSFDTILKTLFIIPFFDSGEDFIYPIIYVGWTLSYEWTFYLFYGSFIAFSIVKWREMYLCSIFFILFLFGFFFPINEIHYIFITNPMFLEFGMGMLIAVLYRNIKRINIFIPILSGIIALVIFSYLIFKGHGEVGEAYLINKGIFTWHRVIIFGIPSALLFICFLFLEKRTSAYFYKNDNLALLGDASYSIYLLHPIIFFILHATVSEQLAFINPDFLVILFVAIAVFLGVLYHKFVEKRLIAIFSTLLLGSKKKERLSDN